MRTFCNLFYTVTSKVIIVLSLLILSWQLSTCFSANTVLYRENSTALKNVYSQWDNYNYETSVYLNTAVEEAIDNVMQYSLYYHRDSTDENTPILSADDNYRLICHEISSYRDFKFAIVNHTTGRIVSNIPDISYAEAGINVRSFFEGDESFLLAIRDAHNPYFESGSITDYNDYITKMSDSYRDTFDLYIYFGDNFCFLPGFEEFEETHNTVLSRVKEVTALSVVYIVIMAILFVLLLLLAGKNEVGGKVYPGLSDRLPNDLKLLLYIIVILSMAALYENSLYMAIRADNYDIWPSYSPDFYIARSHFSIIVNSSIILSAGCTLKRQYRLGTVFTNTYIYKFFFGYRDKK